jgi:hypothetical protein
MQPQFYQPAQSGLTDVEFVVSSLSSCLQSRAPTIVDDIPEKELPAPIKSDLMVLYDTKLPRTFDDVVELFCNGQAVDFIRIMRLLCASEYDAFSTFSDS